ncbi:TonB-dependent receptor [Parafilimonas sp.]|uniref:TonB-dependent receptor n=1 Tax=Parafilimonas sp. TaxID=1969739 RepID=UPI0039E2F138
MRTGSIAFTFLLATSFQLLFATPSRSQSIDEFTISFNLHNEDLPDALKKIEAASPFHFMYRYDEVKNIKNINLSAKKLTVAEALQKILANTVFTYKQVNNQILIVYDNSATKPIIKGKITNASGEPLSSVSITVKNETGGVYSDESGNYTINASAGDTLVFSYVGYNTRQIVVGNQGIINVVLDLNITSLDQVVVVGYGTVKKKDLTGAVSTIGEDDIKSTPMVSLDRALQGRVSGVQVTANSNKPGGGTTVRIRGTGSVNAGNDPLYVIDGYPVGDLNSINPQDIESIDVLKDASATAIYGSRGSNGVVIITTKRGKNGQSNLNFDGYYGIQKLRKKIGLLNAQEYAEFINEARINGGGTAYFDGSSADRPLPSALGKGTDWQDVVFQQAPIQSYQLSSNGGDIKTQYAISGSYFEQEGIIVGSYFKRYSLRANLDRQVKPWFKMGASMLGTHSVSNNSRTETDGGAAGGVTNAALNFAPIWPVYDSTGVYYRDLSALNGNLVDNPLGLAKEVTDQYKVIRLLANAYAEIKFNEDLSFRTTFGADLFNSKENYYATRLIGLGSSVNGQASIATAQNINWLNENTLNYKHVFDKHNINAVIGYTAQAYHNETLGASASNFNNDFALYNNLGLGATLAAPSSGVAEWALTSYLARVNYGYDNRYLLTLTARTDGSSRFGPGNKYGFFPSGAFAWRISDEKFFKRLSWISDAKLRASYGLTGNQAIGDYAYMATIVGSTAILGGASPAIRIGGVPNIISNYKLGWESNKQLDAGLDLGFLNDKIRFTADYYIKNTYNLLFSVSIPQTTGYSSSLSNIGQVRNQGLELALATSLGNERAFAWDANFNLSFNKNKVIKLDGSESYLTGTGSGHLQVYNTVQLKVGNPLGNFYGRVFDGIFQSQDEIDQSAQPGAAPGDIRYKDLDGNGTINDDDRTIIGNGYPKYISGFNNTLSYKGFQLTVFFQGSFGNDILNFQRFDLYNLNGNNNQAKAVVNRWTPTNPSNIIPRANSLGGQRILSSFHIEDGSYIRMKNIALSYSLPQSFIQKIKGRFLKVYVSAQNLWTITKYKGYDPEVNFSGSSATSQGMDYGSYPANKTVILGLNIGL